MLTLMHHNANVHPHPFSSLETLLAEPFPHTPQEMLQLEQRLSTAAAQTADQMVLVQLTRAHEAEAFVTQAIAHARAQSPVPPIHKGLPMTTVLLLGGPRIVIEAPYLREDRRGRRGRRRRTRGPHGAGCYPVLEALGIADRVSPATRSEIALHVVQAASYREAAAMLARRGLACDVSSLVRISTVLASASIRLRDAALEFIADGAEWIWDRTERLTRLAEIPAAKLVEVLDFYHASQYLSETIATCRHMPKAQRQALYKRLRHVLRHQADGVEVVIEELRTLATRQRGKAITRALRYMEAHTHRMRYATLEARKLPIGSGQVESAVRRVINLRFKAPGSFWTEPTVSGLMHLRAAFKAGRWDEVMIGVLTGTCQTPSFAPVSQAATPRSAEAQKCDTPQSFITSRKQAA